MAWGNQKHVPTSMRNACLKRDGYQCTATLNNGQRCTQTTRLEAHHLTQWQEGEKLTVEMLATLCYWHHQRITIRQAAEARRKSAKKKPSAQHPKQTHPAYR